MGIALSETAGALLEIFVFLSIAELLRFALQRRNVPPIIGDVLVGLALAPAALGIVINNLVGFPLFSINVILLAFAQFAVILLVFSAGLEGGVSSLRRAGINAIGAAIAGDLIPFLLATFTFTPIVGSHAALLLGVAAGATSTAVVASLIKAEKLPGTAGAGFLIAASAFDDVAGLVLLSAVILIEGGSFSITGIVGSAAVSIGVWIAILIAAVLVVPRLFRALGPRETFSLPFLILFALAAVVTIVGFSTIVGAFIAGLAVAESIAATRTRQTVEVFLAVLGSLFFITVGLQFDVGLLWDRSNGPVILAAAALLTAIAVGGKIVGVLPFALRRFRRRKEALLIAVGMIPRGEISLLTGTIGLSLHVFDTQGRALGAILFMALLTTGLGSYAFHRLARQAREAERLMEGTEVRPAVDTGS